MPVRKRAFAVGMIRLLRSLGPLHRRSRLPRQQQPDLIRLEYYKAILPFVHVSTGAFAAVRSEVLHLLSAERKAQGRMDSSIRDDAKRLIDKAHRFAEEEISAQRLEDTAKRFGRRVSAFQFDQLDRQIRAGLGVPLSMVEAPVVAKLDEFAAENVTLIRSVSDRYFDRISSDVQDAFESGMRPEDLADTFVERDGMAERDALRIARDQIGKLNAEFNEERQTELGITGYIWRTANDERVRDEHAEREGLSYTWDDPPDEGNPGEPIQCRCYAEPDLTPILEQI